MRIIFAGRDNAFNRRIIQDFSTEHEVVCCLFLEPGRASWKDRCKTIMRRIKKHRLIKVLDQLAFHVFDRVFLRKFEFTFWKTRPEYCDNSIALNCPIYHVNNINDKRWIELCEKMNPDIILATCSHVIFKPGFYNVPPLGTYIIHEGLTPEYKGLHTPLWALMKKEFQYIGYTVFKVNDKIDGGEILTQGTYLLQERENYRAWSWIGHNAIISGLSNIRQQFKELEKKKYFVPVNINNRKSGNYTWMRLSGFLWLYFKNYWRVSHINQSVKSEQVQKRRIVVEAQDATLH